MHFTLLGLFLKMWQIYSPQMWNIKIVLDIADLDSMCTFSSNVFAWDWPNCIYFRWKRIKRKFAADCQIRGSLSAFVLFLWIIGLIEKSVSIVWTLFHKVISIIPRTFHEHWLQHSVHHSFLFKKVIL